MHAAVDMPLDCAICLEPIDDEQTRSCERHAFHDECIATWTQTQPRLPGETATCPICRDPIAGSEAASAAAAAADEPPNNTAANDCRKLCTLWSWVLSVLFAMGWSSYAHAEAGFYLLGIMLSFAGACAVMLRSRVRITSACCLAYTIWVYVRCASGESKRGVCEDPQGVYWCDLNIVWWSFLWLTAEPRREEE